MEPRVFHLRSLAQHRGPENELALLALEIDLDGSWQPVVLDASMPPFRALVCAAFMCQHAYLRRNAAERGLLLDSARGELWMRTLDWFVREVSAHFELNLKQGAASQADLSFIAERMRDCPISRNLPALKKDTTLRVVTELGSVSASATLDKE